MARVETQPDGHDNQQPADRRRSRNRDREPEQPDDDASQRRLFRRQRPGDTASDARRSRCQRPELAPSAERAPTSRSAPPLLDRPTGTRRS